MKTLVAQSSCIAIGMAQETSRCKYSFLKWRILRKGVHILTSKVHSAREGTSQFLMVEGNLRVALGLKSLVHMQI
jgi:hypothetical protein